MLVADIAEPVFQKFPVSPSPFLIALKSWIGRGNIPVYATCILKQPQSYRMHWRIPPPLVKKPARAIQMLEVILVRLTPPKLHICDFEIAPEMTGRVPVRLLVVFRSSFFVFEPCAGVHGVGFEVFRVRGYEFEGFGPEGGDGLRGVVQVDGEAVGLVMVLHVAENVIVDVTEKVDFWFDAPVIADVLEGRMVVEEAAIPTAHLVVGDQVAVLDILFGEDLGAFVEEVVVDPGGNGPVVFGDEFVAALGFCLGAGAGFEFVGEGDVVEEGPGVVEFVVPGPFEVSHGLDHAVNFLVADEGEDGCIDSGGIGIVGGVVICSPELAGGFVGFCEGCQ